MSSYLELLGSFRTILPHLYAGAQQKKGPELFREVEDANMRLLFSTLLYEHYRQISLGKLEGWTEGFRPLDMLQDSFWTVMGHTPDDVVNEIHGLLTRAYQWYGVGQWIIAEDLLKTSMRLSVLHNNNRAALQAVTDLAMCYFAARTYLDCYHAASHAENLSKKLGTHLTSRLLTIKLYSSLTIFSRSQTETILADFRMNPFKPDTRVAVEIEDIYTYLGDAGGLSTFQQGWTMLFGPIVKTK